MTHEAMFTIGLSCGCYVFVREGESIGRALRDTAAGEELHVGRPCPLHGNAEVYALVDNARPE